MICSVVTHLTFVEWEFQDQFWEVEYLEDQAVAESLGEVGVPAVLLQELDLEGVYVLVELEKGVYLLRWLVSY